MFDPVPYKLRYVPWQRWPSVMSKTRLYREYDVEYREANRPVWYTISPKGDLHLYPRPDRPYRIEFFQPKAVQYLEVDTDEPFIDEEYRLAIVYKALMEYALYHDDRSVFERARNKYRTYKKYLEHRHMPDVILTTDVLYKDIC